MKTDGPPPLPFDKERLGHLEDHAHAALQTTTDSNVRFLASEALALIRRYERLEHKNNVLAAKLRKCQDIIRGAKSLFALMKETDL